MPALSITPANVKQISGGKGLAVAAVAIQAGDLLAVSGASVKLADATTAVEADAFVVGMALNDGAVGQPISFALPGSVVELLAGTEGTIYVLGIAGQLQLDSDLTTDDYVTVVGVVHLSAASQRIKLLLEATGVQKP